jgi:hypothetical protein
MARPLSEVSDYQAITIRIPRHIINEMRAVSEAEDRSLNQQIVRIIKRWYAEQPHGIETAAHVGQVPGYSSAVVMASEEG